MTSLRPVLLVDSDSGKLEKLSSDFGTGQVPLICAVTAKDARLRLVDLGLSYSGIFINPAIEEPRGLGIIRLAHERQIGTPIYVIESGEGNGFDEEELKRLAIQGVLKKPVSYEEICRIVSPSLSGFDADGSILESTDDEIHLSAPGSVDEEYVSILARNFLSGRKSFFDLYVRLSSGRYMKILKAGDEFESERLESYFKKGVTQFYLRREAQSRYLGYCDQLAEAVLKSRTASVEAKVAATLNLGQETISYLRRNGMAAVHLDHATKFVDALGDFVRDSKISDLPEIRRFMENLVAYDHGVSTALVGSLVARKLGLKAARSQRLVGLACLFHDLGLENAQEMEVRALSGGLSPEEQSIFQDHPSESANIVRKMEGVEGVVADAISQHHERRDGRGFPLGLSGVKIQPIAEIVGVCDEFVTLIHRAEEDRQLDPFAVMSAEVLHRFSEAVADAFVSVFL